MIDHHPVRVGPTEVHAAHLQEWLEADAADGFWILPDMFEDGVDAFVDQVVPLLRKRGLHPEDHVGTTLRRNPGVPDQYGRAPRIS